MLASDATVAEKLLTPIVTGIVAGIGIAINQAINHRRGKRKDASGASALDEIKTIITDNHTEMRDTCQQLGLKITEAREIATEALSHAIGPDRKNGLRSRVDALEAWQENETIRERDRLQRIADARQGLGPNAVGTFKPGAA